jgi:PrtD family type I secretion system ABC transporter
MPFFAINRYLIVVIPFSMILSLFQLTGSLFMLQIYDRVIPSRNTATLVALVGIVFGIYIFQAILDHIRSRIFARMAVLFDQTIGPKVFDAMVALSLTAPHFGDGLQPVRDVATIRTFLSGGGPMVLLDLPWVPFFLAICFMFHVLIGATATAGAVVLVLIAAASEGLSGKSVRRQNAYNSRQLALASAAYRNAEALASMGMTSRIREKWREAAEAQSYFQLKGLDLVGGLAAISRAVRLLLQSLVLAVGAYLVINQQATGGVILASSILTARALAPIELVIGHWRGAISARQSWARIQILLKGVPNTDDRFALPAPTKSLVVQDVYIRPPGLAKALVSGVRFELNAGVALGVIGQSGSGKSTLARALAGAWPVMSGAIRLDGAPLSQWNPGHLGVHIGYLPQDVELFEGTISQNISRFETPLDAPAVIQAARAAGVHDLILRFENGYEFEIGEGGRLLSKGVTQRIALARALYREPFLIVLDEPNAHLDHEGDEALVDAIFAAKSRGGIVIVVAHRPHVIKHVDYVLVMHEGRAQAFGSRDDVLKRVLVHPPATVAATVVQQPADQPQPGLD